LQQPKSRILKGVGDLLVNWYLGRELHSLADRELAAVITNGPVGMYVPTNNGSNPKKLHFYHGTYRQQAEAIRPFIKYRGYLKLKWWDSMVLERASGAGKQVLCNSDQTLEEVRRFFGYQGVTTWLPLDTSHFRPLEQADCRRRLGLPEGVPVGLFAGINHPMKGFPIVRTLIQSLSGVHWLLALRGGIPTKVQDNPRVQVFRNAAYDLLPTLYNAADFAVFPSRYEAFGYVVAEALACGTPVIASPGGASRLFLQDRPLSSLMIEDADDSDSFFAVARSLLNDVPLYKRAAIEKARPRVIDIMSPENWWPNFFKVTGL
jgi:glycosyltransferase involved in cell wall biosynthesis